MSGIQLDDLLKDDKRDNLLPDLSKATCESAEEFRRLMECCPEFRIKPEKVRKEDARVRDKDFTWKTTKRELRSIGKEWCYGDPVPPDMRSLDLQELQQVGIDWRMLTPIRPKLRADEDMFSRLVEMGKLAARTRARERRSFVSPVRRAKNRAGIVESSVKICGDCGEEFCAGESCGDVLYDSFIRVTVTQIQEKPRITANAAAIIAGMDTSHLAGKSGKKKKGKTQFAGKKTGGGGARLNVRKGTNASKTNARKESNALDDSRKQSNAAGTAAAAGGVKKFQRKCSKYPTKKKSTNAGQKKKKAGQASVRRSKAKTKLR
ncbi:uncharacterized protein LOC106654986 [Trichogramma pretiosum]|uniref:uncharacterized protein LOC106654986 n=1 Tax=Trichogramma pretiosum TaxID=7493 RepID=UPI0006C9527E|nr:uncharacterized protein LOC106654986 [Trichogramma pretiosum]XP_023318510.1 uncharacterized protein LOC106654986 [Trichogramma pretiosum]